MNDNFVLFCTFCLCGFKGKMKWKPELFVFLQHDVLFECISSSQLNFISIEFLTTDVITKLLYRHLDIDLDP